jgi:hypothetical protein
MRLRRMAALVVITMAMAMMGCDREVLQESKRAAFITAPMVTHIGAVEEVRRSRRAGGWQLQRVWHDPADPTNKQRNALENAVIDERGVLQQASYRNETAFGRRYVEFKRNEQGLLVLESRGDGEQAIVAAEPPAVLSTALDLVMFTGPATVIDLATAQAVVVNDVRRVPLLWQSEDVPNPTAQAPSMWLQPTHAPTPMDVVTDRHRQSAPLLESDYEKVRAFAKQTAPSLPAMAAAAALQAGMHSRISPDRAGPPSALNTVTFGGGGDGAACLLVAALRVVGHPSRLVAGLRISDRVGITWAEVHDGEHWQPVGISDDRMALAEGLYTPVMLALVQPGPGL